MSVIEKPIHLRKVASGIILLPTLAIVDCDTNRNHQAMSDARSDQPTGSSSTNQDGLALYTQQCANCHGADGSGGPGGTVNEYEDNYEQLTAYVSETIPVGDVSSCIDQCSEDVAEYMLGAFLGQGIPDEPSVTMPEQPSEDNNSVDDPSDGEDPIEPLDPTDSDLSIILSFYRANIKDTVAMSDTGPTLRQATIIMTERLPSDDEVALAQSKDVGLGLILKALMSGENSLPINSSTLKINVTGKGRFIYPMHLHAALRSELGLPLDDFPLNNLEFLDLFNTDLV